MKSIDLLAFSFNRLNTCGCKGVYIGEVNSNKNKNNNRGHAIVYCVTTNLAIATQEVKGQDVMGSDGKVLSESAFWFVDAAGDEYVLLERDLRPYKILKQTTKETKRLQKEIQEAALAKLTSAEREALGFK